MICNMCKKKGKIMTEERFHINEKGQVRPCKAMPGYCPINNIDGHYDTQEKTQQAYENFMESLTKKNTTVKFFFIKGEEKHAFTQADCAHFAKTMNKSAGLPIIYLGDKETADGAIDDRRWSHFANRLPDGRYIDVEGIWTEKDFLKRWNIDELGSGWKPSAINNADITELRKMGVQSPMFTNVKPAKTLTTMRKYLEPIIELRS